MQDLKGRTIRAGIISVGARGSGTVIRILSIMILGRLLDPTDYGLVTMVTAFTGVLCVLVLAAAVATRILQVRGKRDTAVETEAKTAE